VFIVLVKPFSEGLIYGGMAGMSKSDLPLLDPDFGSWDEIAINRRQFLKLGVFATSGIVTVTLGGITTRFMVGTALEVNEGQWISLAPISELPPGNVHKLKFKVRTVDAWLRDEREGVLYAFTDDGKSYTALDATCTHLGCLVRWKEGDGRFSCPCHEGVFTKEGEVISGAPTKPLRRLTTKIENGTLMALI
jgi:Rieske Fe-S protein